MSLHQPTVAPDSTVARDVITMHAYTTGLKAGALSAAVMATAVISGHTFWPAFRTRVGASGKTGLIVSAFMGPFAIVADKRLLEGARNPAKYLAELDPDYVEVKLHDQHKLKWHHRLANHIYEHPYRSLVSIGLPLVGSIFAYQATNTAIQRSQQIMHTRLYGQAAVVVLLLSSMGFHDYMHSRGGVFVATEDGEEQH